MIFLHYTSDDNVGDRSCCPRYYFPRYAFESVYNLFSDRVKAGHGPIVLGGGGILIQGSEAYYKSCVATGRPCVLWGAGTNLNPPESFDFSCLGGFAFVGIRDWLPYGHYLPCASCLHPSIRATSHTPSRRLMVYESSIHIPIQGDIHMHNSWLRMDEVIDAMLDSQAILTNSYHGAYWAMLLQRRVLLFRPRTTRFEQMRYVPPVVDETNYKDHLDGGPIAPPDYLDECVSLNVDAFRKVSSL